MIPIYKSSKENKLHAFVILLIIVLTSSIHLAFGQEVSGTITDKETGEPLVFANVLVIQPYCALPIGTTTDFDGRFKLTLDAGIYDLKVMYIGYEDMIVEDVHVPQNKDIDISLNLGESVMICCTMVCYGESKFDFNLRRPRIKITPEQLSAIPSVASTLDLAAYIKLIPGVVRIKNKKKRLAQQDPPVDLEDQKTIVYSCGLSGIVMTATREEEKILSEDEVVYEVGNLELPHNESRNEDSFGLKCYPNPTAGQLTIKLEGEIEIVNLTDITGKLLEQINVNEMDQTQVDLSSYPNGIYLLQYHNGEKISSSKVILTD